MKKRRRYINLNKHFKTHKEGEFEWMLRTDGDQLTSQWTVDMDEPEEVSFYLKNILTDK